MQILELEKPEIKELEEPKVKTIPHEIHEIRDLRIQIND